MPLWLWSNDNLPECKYKFMIIVHFDSLLNPAVTVMETD